MIGLIMCALSSLVLFQWVYFLLNRPKNVPPGPPIIPLFGNAWVFLLFPADKLLRYMLRKYGPAVTIYAGCSTKGMLIVVMDWDAIHEIANSKYAEAISDRPPKLNELRQVKEGIIWGQWEGARDRRKFLIRSLKLTGFESGRMNANFEDELSRLFNYVSANLDKPIHPDVQIAEAIGSCILISVYGHRLDVSDPDCKSLFVAGRKFIEGHLYEMLFLPYLGVLTSLGAKDKTAEGERIMERVMTKWLRNEMDRRKSNFNPEALSDVLDCYIASELQGSNNISFEHFMRSMVDAFIGSFDNTSRTIDWAMFYLAHMPDEQERIYREIEAVVPSSSYPSGEHRKKLPRLEAFFQESTRFSYLTIGSFPKYTKEAIRFGPNQCYEVPANGTMWFTWAPNHFDERHFSDPHNFRVDRWLDPHDPSKVLPPHHIMQFGLGRRVCPGEQMALHLQTMVLASFIQRYKWRLETYVPFTDANLRLTRIAPEHRLVFTQRA